MIRVAVLALCLAACGRSHGVSDQDLPGLVVEVHKADPPIDIDRAARDPAELGRALARPYRATLAALGPHGIAINTTTTVDEAGTQVSELSDHAQIDNGDDDSYRAVYTNSADYGRETTFTRGKLYLRPRYQRWHARAPESPDEPAALRDDYASAIGATWELLAPGAELSDRGAIEVAGRAGRKIAVALSPDPRRPAREPLSQRKWREARSVDAVSGEVVLDTDKGVPLAVKLSGSVGFTRDGKRFTMKVSVDSTISGVGSPAMILAPSEGDVVATPERLREVDDRDYLLQGIAPPLRRNPDGTAVAPAPRVKPGEKLPPQGIERPADAAGSRTSPGSPGPKDKAAKAGKKPGPDPAKVRPRSDEGARP
ncbi:MAG TPA: hypothetical protein VFK02_13880 [Kofleriaceae bacterium]|nr:hypothetical protein [Kofleriaceae bacterium]